jgi:hypothetical protein
VPCYRKLAEPFMGFDADEIVRWMLADLERAGAVKVVNGSARPTMAA